MISRAGPFCCLALPLALAAVEVEAQPTAQPDQEPDQAADAALDGAKRENELVVIPNPSYNPTFGAMLTLMGLYAYRPEGHTGKPWMFGAAAFGTQNGTWGALAFHEARPGDDAWRIQAAAGYVDLRYDYYGTGDDSPLYDDPVELRQRIALGALATLKRFGDWSYVGPVVAWRGIRTTPDEPGPLDLEVRQSVLGLGIKTLYDSRDEQFSPTRGQKAELRLLEQAEIAKTVGGIEMEQESYERLEAVWNGYRLAAKSTVLAGRVSLQWVSDDTPFYDQPFLGRGADLRGYSGQYRDRTLGAVQGEIRQGLPYRFGLTAFAGVGAVAPSIAELATAELHPSLGGGVTYLVATANRINARFDAAWGDEGWTFYLSVGDAF